VNLYYFLILSQQRNRPSQMSFANSHLPAVFAFKESIEPEDLCKVVNRPESRVETRGLGRSFCSGIATRGRERISDYLSEAQASTAGRVQSPTACS
jgi:hypothetical protein